MQKPVSYTHLDVYKRQLKYHVDWTFREKLPSVFTSISIVPVIRNKTTRNPTVQYLKLRDNKANNYN